MLRLVERFRRRGSVIPEWRGSAHTPLARLAAVAIDTETTGLDPRRDRIVSIAAIHLDGFALADEPALDLLVNPGVSIPPHATHIHGIADEHVAGAASFDDAYARLRSVTDGALIIGHLVGFDLTVIAAEARRRGLPWRQPAFLDTARMAAALDPRHRHLDLAELLRAYGIEAAGRRHQARDDARMAAQLYVALAQRLAGQGRGSFGAVAHL
jgi:DNA polymerase III epsilon subunit-like protein